MQLMIKQDYRFVRNVICFYELTSRADPFRDLCIFRPCNRRPVPRGTPTRECPFRSSTWWTAGNWSGERTGDGPKAKDKKHALKMHQVFANLQKKQHQGSYLAVGTQRLLIGTLEAINARCKETTFSKIKILRFGNRRRPSFRTHASLCSSCRPLRRTRLGHRARRFPGPRRKWGRRRKGARRQLRSRNCKTWRLGMVEKKWDRKFLCPSKSSLVAGIFGLVVEESVRPITSCIDSSFGLLWKRKKSFSFIPNQDWNAMDVPMGWKERKGAF